MEIQANGLSGHLDETWPDVGPNSGWLGGNGESWERGPYYLDGLVPLAYHLDDARLKAKVQPWMEWTLKSQAADGNFGPKIKSNDWWPRMVMLKALIQYEDATSDPRVKPFLEKYFEYQRDTLPRQPLASWAKYRWEDNLLSVMWLYDRTGDPKLLELATLLRDQGHDFRTEFDNFQFTGKCTRESLRDDKKNGTFHDSHGVDIAMGLKSAALWSRISNDPEDRRSTAKMLAVLDRYHGLPNGMYSADEHLSGRNPSQGTELCTVVEVMYSLEQAIAVTGDAALADRLEKIAFNALPGAISDDMWSHQYDQQPNQIECSSRPRPWSDNGPDSNLFGLAPNFGCCTANYHQGWPKLTSSLWMRSGNGGLTAVVYAPCVVSTQVDRTLVKLQTVTEYPFRNVVQVLVQPDAPVAFAMGLRVPEGSSPKVQVNGKAVESIARDGFLQLKRTWTAGDTVRIEFAMHPRVMEGFDNSVSVMRGPLVFSLPIEEKWNKLRDQGMTADWEILGQSPWNYGLVNATEFTLHENPIGGVPFGKSSPPVTIQAEAMKVKNWAATNGNAGEFPLAPKPDGPPGKVTLVPYASTKLRMTAMPKWKATA
jgi:DUF1680 family protein